MVLDVILVAVALVIATGLLAGAIVALRASRRDAAELERIKKDLEDLRYGQGWRERREQSARDDTVLLRSLGIEP